MLHFVADSDEPHRVVAELRDAIAPGSYLALSHLGSDFVDVELVPPGLVAKHDWRPDGITGHRTGNVSWGGVGRK